MRKENLILFLIALLVVGCGSKGEVRKGADGKEVLSGYITVSGAFALYPLVIQWADEFHRLHPEVDIDVSAGGAGKGITDVLADQVDIGMVSRELKPQEVEKGTLAFAVAKDAVVPTINAHHPMLKNLEKVGLSREMARKLWLSAQSKVHVYTRSDACGAAETWAAFLGVKQEDLKGTALFGDPGVAETLQKDVDGIGYNNIGYAYHDKTHRPLKGLAIIPIDVNGNGKIDDDERFYDTMEALMQAVSDGRYPTPPSRNLYLVTAGKPKNSVVREFLKYVLTRGQRLNAPAGFVKMNEQQVKQGLRLL